MHRIYLTKQSKDQFISNINEKKNGTLIFIKKYYDIQEWLISTNLISDLRNIIMTYVNDEIKVEYNMTLDGRFINFHICCSIWLQSYLFDYVLAQDQFGNILRLKNNNILRLSGYHMANYKKTIIPFLIVFTERNNMTRFSDNHYSHGHVWCYYENNKYTMHDMYNSSQWLEF